MNSPRLLARFRDGARDHLARADALLMRLERDPGAAGASAELLRILHTIKGESRAMGLAEAADHAHRAEGELVAWTREPGSSATLKGVGSALAAIEALVEARVGALRLHSSGARALPARKAAPSMDLGDVEIGQGEFTRRVEEAPGDASPEPAETVRVPLDKLDALANISGDLFLGEARAEDRQQRLDDLLALAQRQQRLAQTLRRVLGPRRARRRALSADADAAAAETEPGVAGEAADELLELARALRRSLGEAVRAERDDLTRARLASLELAERLRDLRLLPLATLFDDCPHVVRDLAEALGREVRIQLHGAPIDVDRHVVEELRDPILHLVQNAVDHGIEPPSDREAAGKPREGIVEIRASIEGDGIVLEVADDGRGIDPAALRAAAISCGLLDAGCAAALDDEQALDLIFLPEFSSRAEVSAISGRGVGLDVVRDRVVHLHGKVSVLTRLGKGTRFILRIPRALGGPHELAHPPSSELNRRPGLDRRPGGEHPSRPDRTSPGTRMTSPPAIHAGPRTRIAPSPTGDPHVGTAYQAVFNKALAEASGGQFLLRIEDTDRVRFNAESEAMIFRALRWLDLGWHEGPDVGGPHAPYRQSERLPLYKRHAEELVAKGAAYRCFCTAERLERLRAAQSATKQPPRYDRACSPLSAEESASRAAVEAHVIRLRIPSEGTTIVKDLIRGEIPFENALLDDQVLLKSDGFPTYHLAVVVDDHDMGISHVVRGEEWIPSTPKHLLLYEAFGWAPPLHCHTPLLRNPDRTKLSKRKNPTSIEWFKAEGYLPEALVNFLCTMGWSHPEGLDKFDWAEFRERFTLERIHLGGPIFDLAKLDHINGLWLRSLSVEEVGRRVVEGGFTRHAAADPALLHGALLLVRDRLVKLSQFDELTVFFFEEPVPERDALATKVEPALLAAVLDAAVARLEAATEWSASAIDGIMRGVAEGDAAAEGGIVKKKDLFMSARVAVTGRTVSTPLFETMQVIGRERSLHRLRGAVATLRRG